MWQSIVTIASAVGALAGLLTLIYKYYLSPTAKRKKQAIKDGKTAVDKGDLSGITSAFDKLRRGSLILIFLLIAGCSSPKVVLHPISGQDIMRVTKGISFEPPKDGYFISDLFLKDVMEAKVE